LGRDSSELLPQSRPKPAETFGVFFETFSQIFPKKKFFSQIFSSDFFGLLARALSEFFGFFCPNFSDFFVRIFRTTPLQVLALESKSVLLKNVRKTCSGVVRKIRTKKSEKFGQKNPKTSDSARASSPKKSDEKICEKNFFFGRVSKKTPKVSGGFGRDCGRRPEESRPKAQPNGLRLSLMA
jgi:hypothetical protein